MTSYAQARAAIISLIPALKGWTVYTDGIATGKKPPWIVVSLSENGREHTEGLAATNHLAKLNVRVVSTSETSIGVICDKLISALDGASPGGGVGSLVPDIDSGVYASELIDPVTSVPFLMRVLTWRTGWPA